METEWQIVAESLILENLILLKPIKIYPKAKERRKLGQFLVMQPEKEFNLHNLVGHSYKLVSTVTNLKGTVTYL